MEAVHELALCPGFCEEPAVPHCGSVMGPELPLQPSSHSRSLRGNEGRGWRRASWGVSPGSCHRSGASHDNYFPPSVGGSGPWPS